MDSAPQKASAAHLLRQRFGNPSELHRHLHDVDGMSIFFYRTPTLDLAGGSRVLLEVNFTSTEQQTVLRGAVFGRVEGPLAGLWLEFPDTGLSRRANEGALALRKQKRVGCDVLIEVRQPGKPCLGRLIDLSLGGARLAGLPGIRINSQVEVRVVSPNNEWPSELGRAMVVRSENREVGTRFLRDQSHSRIAITRLFGALQDSWTSAPEVSHPPVCCSNGQLIEPPLPRISRRLAPL